MSKYALLVPAAFALVLMTGCGEAPKPIVPGESAQPTPPAPTVPVAPAPEVKKPDAPVANIEAKGTPAAPKEELKPAPAGATDGQVVNWKSRAGEFSMTAPVAWKQEAASGLRQVQMRIPKVGNDAEDSELVGFNMPNSGGFEGNLPRWEKQMGGDGTVKNKKGLKTAVGADAMLAELEGSYSAMSPVDGSQMPAKAGYKMLGAHIPTKAGDVYFKLYGPKETVDAQKAAFEKMVESFK